MKNLVNSLIGFLLTLTLLFVMTSLIAKPKPPVVKPKDKPESVLKIVKEKEPEPTRQQPVMQPTLAIQQSLDINMEIQVDPIELTDLTATEFTPATTNLVDALGLPSFESMPLQELDSQAIPLMQTPPSYPIDALQKGIEGWVKLRFDVAASGLAENVKVVSASHKKLFDREAKKALKQWRFKAGKENGLPVGLSNQTVTMEFNLEQN